MASTANNLQILDFGLTMAVPAIVIAALTGMNDDMNANEYVRVTAMQASWLGKSECVCDDLIECAESHFCCYLQVA